MNEIPPLVTLVAVFSLLLGLVLGAPRDDYLNWDCGSAPLYRHRGVRSLLDGNSTSDAEREAASAHSGINKRLERSSPYIMNGYDVQYGDFPSLVLLSINKRDKTFVCTGTIYKPKEVFTAGHCVRDIVRDPTQYSQMPNDCSIEVLVGEDNRHELGKDSQSLVVEAFQQVSKGSRVLDVARLFLREPIRFNDHVQPACVGRQRTTVDRLASGGNCYAVGWGTSNDVHGSEFPTKAQYFHTRQTKCANYKGMGPDTFCFSDFKGQNRRTCGGDSGSPVLCLDENKRWNVVAVHSGGLNCDKNDQRVTRGSDLKVQVSALIEVLERGSNRDQSEQDDD